MNTGVPQRAKDIAKAKALLSAAGAPVGFTTRLIGNNTFEIPSYGQIVAQGAKSIG